MEELIPDLANLPLALVLGIFGWRILNLLTIVAKAYDTNAKARNTDTGEQATEAQRRRKHEDDLAVKLAEYQANEAAYKKDQAELNRQTALINAEIAKTLPTLVSTQQQTLATVQETGPQIEAVSGDLRTLMEQGHTLIQQGHELISTALERIRTEQGVQGEIMGRIEEKQDAAIAS